MTGAIFCETRPAMIIKSDWRGEGRKTSAPKRAISKRDAPIDIISIAQQARPKVIGQMEFLRTQFTTLSSEARITPSCCCSPNVARRTWRRSSTKPMRFSARSAPDTGFSNFGGRLLVPIAVIIPVFIDEATGPKDAASAHFRRSVSVFQQFEHADDRHRQTLI